MARNRFTAPVIGRRYAPQLRIQGNTPPLVSTREAWRQQGEILPSSAPPRTEEQGYMTNPVTIAFDLSSVLDLTHIEQRILQSMYSEIDRAASEAFMYGDLSAAPLNYGGVPTGRMSSGIATPQRRRTREEVVAREEARAVELADRIISSTHQISDVYRLLGNSSRGAVSAVEEFSRAMQPHHPEAGAVIKPARMTRSVLGVVVENTRGRDGGVVQKLKQSGDGKTTVYARKSTITFRAKG